MLVLGQIKSHFFLCIKSSCCADELAKETCHFHHLPLLTFVPTAGFVCEDFKFPSKSHRTPPRSVMSPYLQLWLQNLQSHLPKV